MFFSGEARDEPSCFEGFEGTEESRMNFEKALL
jgi:hypothetical protein